MLMMLLENFQMLIWEVERLSKILFIYTKRIHFLGQLSDEWLCSKYWPCSSRNASKQLDLPMLNRLWPMIAQYGLALGLLCLAKDFMNLGAFKWGVSLLEEASEVARASAYSVRNVSCRKTLPTLPPMQLSHLEEEPMQFQHDLFSLAWLGMANIHAKRFFIP
ncbi:hypothetical protein HN51_066739 [Arachis hypogaea]